ncbi:MAG: hypothetical protein KA180_17620 [Gemmatimonadales bacterium]|nr:hypothetical protein [Gemmatimonadota bacterium]MBP6671278.1 hypothetical protein [Gemmatimonadales bacterium]MBP9201092.1 hypothetical protein [Gemmatimonadales bacterium]
MLFLQAGVVAGWVGPTMAISLVIIAGAFLVIAAASALAARQAAREMQQLSRVIESLRTDLAPALTAVQAVSGEGQRLAGMVGTEAEELVLASRQLREGLKDRLANLEAIYEVLEEEIEDTAVDVAVTLRTFRSGAGWFGRIRRLLGGGRRR